MIKQEKRGRSRSEKPLLVHTAVALPQNLVERLRKDAEKKGRGLSTEIRQRLQMTYEPEGLPRDPETENLLTAIRELANVLARDIGKKWHQHPYALKAFKEGVATFLKRYYPPEGDENRRPDTEATDELHDPPDVVGRTHARAIAIGKNKYEGEEDEYEDE